MALATFGTVHAQAAVTAAPPPAPAQQGAGDYFDSQPNKGPGDYQQPPLSKQEISMFLDEMKNVGREATQMLKQMKGANVAAELAQSLQNVTNEARQCIESVKGAPLSEETRTLMNDCRSKNLWNEVNDVRQEFVPPSEVKNALRDLDQQKRQVQQVRKQMGKAGGSTAAADELLARLDAMKQAITSAVGQNQRDAMQDFWDARVWDDVNNMRAAVDIPNELKRIEKEMSRMVKQSQTKPNTQALEFFGAQPAALQQLVQQKEGAIAEVKKLVASGDYEDAREVMNDSIHQGWSPGDFTHALDMIREIRRMLKNIRSTDVQQQVKDIVSPVVADFVEGNVRSARDTLVIVQEQVRRVEYTHSRSRYGGPGSDIDDKTMQAIEKLEQMIEAGGGGGGNGGQQFGPPMPKGDFPGGGFEQNFPG